MNARSIRRMSALVGAGVLSLGGAALAVASQPLDDLPAQARTGDAGDDS